MRRPKRGRPPARVTVGLLAAIALPIASKALLSLAEAPAPVEGRYRLLPSVEEADASEERSAHRSLDLRGPTVRGADRPPARAEGGVLATCLRVEESGAYTFLASSDRPSSLFIDGREIARAEAAEGLAVDGGEVHLESGLHPLRVELRGPWREPARISIWMASPGGDIAAIPRESLLPPARCRPPSAMPPSVPR